MSHVLRPPRRLTTAVIVLLITFATSCGSTDQAGSNDQAGHYVELPDITPPAEVDGLTTTTTTGADIAGDSALAREPEPVAQAMFDEVERFYDEYLRVRANVIDGTSTIDALAPVVTSAGHAQVEEALAYNQSLHADERPSALQQLWLFSNVESITQVDDHRILVKDCTERHEVNAFDQFWAYWLTNEIIIDVSSGQMQVADYTTTHNGFIEADVPIGCAPSSFRERAETAAAQGWVELTAWARDPESRTRENLSRHIRGPLRQRVLRAADKMATTKFNEVREESNFTAIGLDNVAALGTEGAKNLVVVVDSCHRFPDGRTGTDIATGAALEDLKPGAEQALRFRVLIDTRRDKRVDQVIAIDYLAAECAS